jgi:hypothetical protein
VLALACTSVERTEVHDVTQAMALSDARVVEINGVALLGYVASSREGPTLVTPHEKKIPLRPSDRLTLKVRYHPGDVVTPEVAVALRERSVEMIVGGASLFTLGGLIAPAAIYAAVTYKEGPPPTCICFFDPRVGLWFYDAFAAIGVLTFTIGVVLVSVGTVARASIKSAVPFLSPRGLAFSF